MWLFPQGQGIPFRVGSYIRAVLKETPAAQRYLWHAAYHDGFYRLAVISPGQGPNDNSPCGEQWWLDLRDGPPRPHEEARWYGPMIYKFPGDGTYESVGDFVLAVDNLIS